MSQIDTLPPLRDIVREHGLMAKRSLGQNFLFDLNLTSRIARSSGKLEGATVVEVGPGPGGLTRALLAGGAEHVIAIERDTRCFPILEQIAQHYPGRLTIIEGDALEVDVLPYLKGREARIVSNLPYNIATPLLTGWISSDRWPPWWQSLTLMFQREVAERIVATSETPADYGRLGVLCGWRTEAHILFDVPPSAFVPAPKVTSSIVHLTPKLAPESVEVKGLEMVAKAAFGQRRKMLRQSLKGLALSGEVIGNLLEKAQITPTMRAEEVSVSDFIRLANIYQTLR